jgi:hypothetical protein
VPGRLVQDYTGEAENCGSALIQEGKAGPYEKDRFELPDVSHAAVRVYSTVIGKYKVIFNCISVALFAHASKVDWRLVLHENESKPGHRLTRI